MVPRKSCHQLRTLFNYYQRYSASMLYRCSGRATKRFRRNLSRFFVMWTLYDFIRPVEACSSDGGLFLHYVGFKLVIVLSYQKSWLRTPYMYVMQIVGRKYATRYFGGEVLLRPPKSLYSDVVCILPVRCCCASRVFWVSRSRHPINLPNSKKKHPSPSVCWDAILPCILSSTHPIMNMVLDIILSRRLVSRS